MGDFVFVELPEVGDRVHKGAQAGIVESVRAVSEVFAPVTCVIRETNSELRERPELLNYEPFGAGWLFQAEILDREELKGLYNFVSYKSTVLNEIEHVLYLDEANVLHYLSSVRRRGRQNHRRQQSARSSTAGVGVTVGARFAMVGESCPHRRRRWRRHLLRRLCRRSRSSAPPRHSSRKKSPDPTAAMSWSLESADGADETER